MERYSPYLYNSEDRKRLIAEDAYESFMYTLLGPLAYEKREKSRLLRKAVSLVVDDIMREHFGAVS